MRRPRKAINQLFEAQAIVNVLHARLLDGCFTMEGRELPPAVEVELREAITRLRRYQRANTGRIIKSNGRLTRALHALQMLINQYRGFGFPLTTHGNLYYLKTVYCDMETIQTHNELLC